MLPPSDPLPPSPPRRCRLKWAIYAFVSTCLGCIIWASALAVVGHRKAAIIMAATAGSFLIVFPWLAVFFNMVRTWYYERQQHQQQNSTTDSSDSSTKSAPKPSPSDPAPTIYLEASTLRLDTSTEVSLQPSPSNPPPSFCPDHGVYTSSSAWPSLFGTKPKRYVSAPLPGQEPDLGPTLHHNESARSASFSEYLTSRQEPDCESGEPHVAPAGLQVGGPTGNEIQLSTSLQSPSTPQVPRMGHSVRTRRSPHQSPGARSS